MNRNVVIRITRKKRHGSRRRDIQRIRDRNAAVRVVAWLNANRGKPGYDEAVRVLRNWQKFAARGYSGGKAERHAVFTILGNAPFIHYPTFRTSKDHRLVFANASSKPEGFAIDLMRKAGEAGTIVNVIQCQLRECNLWAVKRADAEFCCDYHRVKFARQQAVEEFRKFAKDRERLGFKISKRRGIV